MQKAVDKVAVANRLARAIEEEKKGNLDDTEDRPDGYNQLIDENSGERAVSIGGDDPENPLIAEEDETLFKDLDENDPLMIERKNLVKAKRDLDKYLKKRSDSKAKPSP